MAAEKKPRQYGKRASRRSNKTATQVREVMTTDVRLITPDDTIREAATAMAEANLGALPVGENDRLVGVITDRDITIRAVAKGDRPDQCTVREVMSPGIKYVFEDESTEVVAENMSKLQVRRLPVLNRQKRLVGIVSLGDLAARHDPVAAGALKAISS